MGTSSFFSEWVLIAFMLSVKASSHVKLFSNCICIFFLSIISPVNDFFA